MGRSLLLALLVVALAVTGVVAQSSNDDLFQDVDPEDAPGALSLGDIDEQAGAAAQVGGLRDATFAFFLFSSLGPARLSLVSSRRV
jgi:hypothetical protein